MIRQQHELPPLTDLTDNLIKQSANYDMPNDSLRKNKSSSLTVKSRKLLGNLVWNMNRVDVVPKSRGRLEVFNTQEKQCCTNCSRGRDGTPIL